MTTRTIRIRGTRIGSGSRGASQPGGPEPLFRLAPGSARDGAGEEIEVKPETVVRVALENGFVLWSRADDLTREYGTPPARGGSGAWEITRLTPRRSVVSERGAVGLAIRVLEFFGVDLGKKAAGKVGKALEDKQLNENGPGLYRVAPGPALALTPVAGSAPLPTAKGPILVFIHGTASSTTAGYGKLWDPRNADAQKLRDSLATTYGDRVFAFEHRTLTESPIQNAMALLERLPSGADVHLVSHSRGGLVGELLCLSGCTKLADVLTPSQIEAFFAVDRSIAPQMGLAPLSADEAKARNAAYAADRDLLGKFVTLLGKKKIRVSRFARIACPARGTTLASGRLDRWLSVLDYLSSGSLVVGGTVDFIQAVVAERTDPRTLPGIEAMIPGSALTRLLNSVPALVTEADLAVIAGDIEGGDSLWNSIKVLATDWFYKNEHDLVVDTASMLGGLPRLNGGARFRKDQGPKVNHFRYFTNGQSINWLRAALTRGDQDSGGFLPIEPRAPRAARAMIRRRADSAPRPIAVVLPGTMGSELNAGDDRVWLSYLSLFAGGLGKLRMGKPDITPVGLVDDFYGPLVDFLARSHDVDIFPYDWRHSIRAAAAKLAETLGPLVDRAERTQQPLRIVAHSMGGLVVRSMIADGGAGAALWNRISRLPGSRFLMLGTPNLGSYEAVRWLTGFNPTQAKLTLLDITHGTDAIIDIVRRYPGLLELLPFAPKDPDFTDLTHWQAIKDGTSASWQLAEAATLKEAATSWKRLRAAPPDPLMCYVAGCQPATVIDYQLVSRDDDPPSSRKKLEFIATPSGDGTVSWDSGLLPGVPTWYVADTGHDALCAQPKAFPGYLDLLVKGSTTLLPDTPPATARAAGVEERFVLPAMPLADSMPGPDDIATFGFSGGAPVDRSTSEKSGQLIRVGVTHGSLAYSRHPVVVGHYQGDTIVSAERAIDWQLQGALSRRLDLGIYPGALGTSQTFFNDSPSAKPAGAVVVGLGEVGKLSPGQLEEAMRSALLDYALAIADWPDDRFGEASRPRSAAISCLLIGTGAGGMPISDSVEAILRAAISANTRLAESEMDSKVVIDAVEFIELYEDLAIPAAHSVRKAASNPELAASLNWAAMAIEPGQSGQHRLRADEPPEWWHRLEIIEDEHNDQTLRFIFPTDKARAEETMATGQLSLADSFIEMASQDTNRNAEAARTLFELLLPVRIKEVSSQQGNLVLLVDKRSARYPWELLEDRWGSSPRPPAVNSGMIRQFKTRNFRARPAHAPDNTALVIGNPALGQPQDFADLPGARDEALSVASTLANAGYDVSDRIDERTPAILEALHREKWRILHLAGHGVHDYKSAKMTVARSGMVIGADTILTPGDIDQMRWVPELVFINCCHIGRMDGQGKTEPGMLAANLAEQFINMGVKAVIAAGWAVDDAAGKTFAEGFYRRMVAGEFFGEAVRAAREETFVLCDNVNTWGAYQCYGDPNYRLSHDVVARQRRVQPYATPHELVVDLDNLASELRDGRDSSDIAERLERRMNRIPAEQKKGWTARADVSAALGFVWGEAADWEKGIASLRSAIAAESGHCTVRVIEQLANFEVRLAGRTWLATEPGQRDEQLRAKLRQAIELAITRLAALADSGPTSERLSLLGAAYKRLALIEAGDGGRREALVNMAEHYRDAFVRKDKTYALTNWASAALMIRRLYPDQPVDQTPLTGLATLGKDIARLRKRLESSNASAPNFWDSASLADLDFVQAMDEAGAGKKSKSASTGDAARQIYRQAVQRGASVRERSSVTEHLDFLRALIPDDDPIAGLIDQIKEDLA
ncbi:MAG: CHAT domain-containing protein [Dechloromonas sp.]|nr:CHAT domain-containing protein [Dechloromonas sp.]